MVIGVPVGDRTFKPPVAERQKVAVSVVMMHGKIEQQMQQAALSHELHHAIFHADADGQTSDDIITKLLSEVNQDQLSSKK